jgi:hypothetical protein
VRGLGLGEPPIAMQTRHDEAQADVALESG